FVRNSAASKPPWLRPPTIEESNTSVVLMPDNCSEPSAKLLLYCARTSGFSVGTVTVLKPPSVSRLPMLSPAVANCCVSASVLSNRNLPSNRLVVFDCVLLLMKLPTVAAPLVKMYTSPAAIEIEPLEVSVYVSWNTLVVGSLIHAPELTTALLKVPTLVWKVTVPRL